MRSAAVVSVLAVSVVLVFVVGAGGSGAQTSSVQLLSAQRRAVIPGLASDSDHPPSPTPSPTPIPNPTGPSSDELIAGALGAGKIDSETALIYRTYAAFADPRLPAAYRGDDSEQFDATDLMSELQVRFPGLSPAGQSTLAPFLKPAFAPGSWYELRPSARSGIQQALAAATTWAMDTVSPHVVIWWDASVPGDAAVASRFRSEIDATIWPKLTGLLGAPLPDGNLPDKGLDGRVDIVIFGENERSYVNGRKDACGNEPAMMHIRRNASLSILAHEFTHLVQFRYQFKTCRWPEYSWLGEATAQWSMHYVYPNDNSEQAMARHMMDLPTLPLDHRNDAHEYSAYLFFLNLTLNHNLSAAVAGTFAAAAANDSLGAINAALGGLGGFDKHWHEFAYEYMNRAPYQAFKNKDGLANQVDLDLDVDAVPLSSGTNSWRLTGAVRHLAASYSRFSFADPSARSVVVENPITGSAAEHGKVQAFWRTKGSSTWHKPEDLTGNPLRTFCFDKPDEDLAELYIVISNAEFKDRAHVLAAGDPKLTVRNSSCKGWVGTIRQTTNANSPGTSYSLSTTASVIFEEDTQATIPGMPPSQFVVKDGSVSWGLNGTIAGCSVSGQGSFAVKWPLAGGAGLGTLTLRTDNDGLYYEGLGTSTDGPITLVCPGEGAKSSMFGITDWWATGNEERYRLTPEGRMKGSYSETTSGATSTWEWDLGPG